MLRLATTFFVIVASFWPLNAAAERRVALVVGNANYTHATPLRNPINDANDMAAVLEQVGFEVILATDLDQHGFARKIDEFSGRLEGADVGLFFYAGHGLQINERNHLVSTQAKLQSEFLISAETIELDAIVRLMESKAPTNLIVLDACRNNPLAENLRRSLRSAGRSTQIGRGLARIEPTGRETLIAFAAAVGQEAADGVGRNSPFTESLLKHLPRPDLEISVMLKEVAADVRRRTRNAQRPQQVSDMARLFYFAKAEPATGPEKSPPKPKSAQESPAAPARTDTSVEVAFWNSVQAANSCEAVRAYLTRFPSGLFVELARLAEERLCAPAQVAVTEPAAAPVSPELSPNTGAPVGVTEPTPRPIVKLGVTPEVDPPRAVPTPELAVPPKPEPDPATIRRVQRELQRVGCIAAEPDGQWGTATQEAVQRFNEHGRWRFDADGPTPGLLTALQRSNRRVCPLECAAGYRPRGNTCVAVRKLPSLKKKAGPGAARPRQEQRRPSRRAEPRRVPTGKRAQPSRARAAQAPPRVEPQECFIDLGYGRRQPCDAGGGR